MKKLMMFSVAFVFALTAAAAGEAVPEPSFTTFNSSNTLGIQRTCKTSESMQTVAVPFVGVSGELTLKDALYVDNLGFADTVEMMYNSSDRYYDQWLWLPGFLTDLRGVARDFHEEISPADQNLVPGMCLRVTRDAPTNPVYVVGQYQEEKVSHSFNKGTSSYLANYSTEMLDVETDLTGAVNGDTIIVEDNDGGVVSYLTYRYSTTGENGRHWYRTRTLAPTVVNGEVVTSTENVYDIKKIAPGEGFRYQRGNYPIAKPVSF